MSHNNYKNLLQEYCQKYDLSLPKYTHIRVGGEDHAPLWSATIYIENCEFEYNSEQSYHSSKIAEKQLAKEIYEKILEQGHEFLVDKCNDFDEVQNNTKIFHDTSDFEYYNALVFIDLENIQPTINYYTQLHDSLEIYGFVSSFSTVKTDKYKSFKIDRFDYGGSEAVDHRMTYVIGKMVPYVSKDRRIVIVSRDKSSAILVHLLRLDGFDVTHITNAKECDKLLHS